MEFLVGFLGVMTVIGIGTSKQFRLTLNVPQTVHFYPNTYELYDQYNWNEFKVKKTALLFGTYYFTAPSTGVFRITLENANISGVCQLDMYVYRKNDVPTVTSNWETNLFRRSSEGFGQSYESVDLSLNGGTEMAIIIQPYWVYKRSNNLYLTAIQL